MRTVVALLLLAVAANAYTVKMGGLKGSWFSNFIVTGPADDSTAPTLTGFTLNGAAADYSYNQTMDMGSYGYDDYWNYDYTPADSGVTGDVTCSTYFELWDATGTMVLNDLDIYEYFSEVYLYYNTWPGTYASRVWCVDYIGNSKNFMKADGTYDFIVQNNYVDMDSFVISNIATDTTSLVITDTFATTAVTMSFDIADVATPGMWDHGCNDVRDGMFTGSWFSASTGMSTPWSAMATCTTDISGTTGSCSYTEYVAETNDIGVLTVTSVSVRDYQGNMATMTAALVMTVTSTATADVISCQTITLSTLEDQITPVIISTTYDYLDLDVSCTIKTSVSLTTNSIYVQYAHDQAMMMDGVVMSSPAYSGTSSDTFDSLGAASPSVYFEYGLPGGLWRLDTVTTVTGYGGIQLYTFALGSASSVAPSMVAIAVAAAVAFLRL